MRNQSTTISKNRSKSFLWRSPILLIALVFTSFAVQSQTTTLADFAKASTKKYSNAVPYKDMREDVKELQGKKEDAWEKIKGYKARDITEKKKLNLGFLEDQKGYLAKAKSELSKDDGESSSETTRLKNEVKKHETDIKETEKILKDLNAKIEEGIKRWHQVNVTRAAVGAKYKAVYSKLGDSYGSPAKHLGPAPSSSDKEATEQYKKDVTQLKKYIDTIKRSMDTAVREHVQAVNEAKKAEEAFKTAKGLR